MRHVDDHGPSRNALLARAFALGLAKYLRMRKAELVELLSRSRRARLGI